MDALTLFGLLTVTAMLVFYALEDRNPRYILAMAGTCLLASVYGFLQGAWPFGVLEVIWAGVAFWRWRSRTRLLNPR
jgi:NADH:ubiquinone oxidoreductase subunit 6 (subunit J)